MARRSTGGAGAVRRKVARKTAKRAAKRRSSGRRGVVAAGSVAERLDALARNFWWTWHPDAVRLFESIDPDLWRATGHNPIRTIREANETRRAVIETDPAFADHLERVESSFADSMRATTWHAREATGKQKKMLVAYFCMEYGLHECVPLYSGGLGILAADHLKSASDLGVPMVALGMLWRHGYYRQEILPNGEQRILYPRSDFEDLPVDDLGVTIDVPMGRSSVRAKLWRLQVGRVPLVLLDADLPENKPKDRELTHHLYGGDNEHRIRQEVLLGVGGVLALDALGIEPSVLHLNEGHAAFAPLERVRQMVAEGVTLKRAVERVRAHSVFTTHTPVPAGNDRFEPKLFNKYMSGYAAELGITPKQLLGLGREDVDDRGESFCMTVLALKLAERCNGVAELHGEVSRGMWKSVFGVDDTRDVPIGHVTNGVHPQTWIADEARPFYDTFLKPAWDGAGPEDDWWAGARSIPAEELWELRQTLRRAMIVKLRTLLRAQHVYHQADQDAVNALYDSLDEDALTIGFARRFATYKRAPLIFRDRKRLAAILQNDRMPVQIVFAGKAHPKDKEGQAFVTSIAQMTRAPEFRGRVHLIQNYDTSIGRLLTSGCDVWLNNPIRPMEASGTSGMKPPLNGGVNCSILDGWWPEGFNGKNGWALGTGAEHSSRAKQDREDAEAIYRTLEREVVPLFYERDRRGVPRRWTRMMAESMRSVCAKFSTHRMLADYCERAYWPANG